MRRRCGLPDQERESVRRCPVDSESAGAGASRWSRRNCDCRLPHRRVTEAAARPAAQLTWIVGNKMDTRHVSPPCRPTERRAATTETTPYAASGSRNARQRTDRTVAIPRAPTARGGTIWRRRADSGCILRTTAFQRPYSKYCLASAFHEPRGVYPTHSSGSNTTVLPALRSRMFNS